jgi:hypothetical protein
MSNCLKTAFEGGNCSTSCLRLGVQLCIFCEVANACNETPIEVAKACSSAECKAAFTRANMCVEHARAYRAGRVHFVIDS